MQKSYTPKISIIIPVYNVGDYLRDCLDSVASQDYNNFEAILVDDGSRDNSGDICDEYSERYDFVVTLHQTNGGTSAARNAGMDAARGEWITFLDGDDILCKGALSRAVKEGLDESIDIYFYGTVRDSDDGTRFSAYPIPSELNNKTITDGDFMRPVVWGALYNRAFIERHELRFLLGVINSQDSIFARFTHHYSHVVHLNDFEFCHIRHRDGSASRSWSEKRFNTYIDNFAKIESEIIRREIDFRHSISLNRLVYGMARYLTSQSLTYNSDQMHRKVYRALRSQLEGSSIYPVNIPIFRSSELRIFNLSLKLYVHYRRFKLRKESRR